MPVYEYKALDKKGASKTGVMDAGSTSVVREKLRASNKFPVSIKEIDTLPAKKQPKKYISLRFFSRIKQSEVSIMTRQLATLLAAGFPLVSAMDILITQTRSHAFKKILSQLKDFIVEGNSFAETLSLYPDIFSQLYINMVKAGETSGTLEIVLERLADITEKQQALIGRIRSALTYPVFMFFVGSLVLFLLMSYIVPNITAIFTDMNQTLPAITRLLISISSFFKSSWWMMAIVAAGIVFTVNSLKKTKKGRFYIDTIKLFMPVMGAITRKLAVSRFARTLGSLLENGISMLTALEIVKNITGNVLISNAIENAATEVEKGQGLGAALSASAIIPYLSIQMIQVGEQSGALESMLNKVADMFESEVESSIMSMTSMLEPIMILFMGIVVFFIVLSIMLPIFEMNQLVM
jgi:general secretion pathway protein F